MELEIRLKEMLRLVYEAHVSIVFAKEEIGEGNFQKLLPYFDKTIQMEDVLCRLMGVSGDEMIAVLKEKEFSVEDAVEEMVRKVEGKNFLVKLV